MTLEWNRKIIFYIILAVLTVSLLIPTVMGDKKYFIQTGTETQTLNHEYNYTYTNNTHNQTLDYSGIPRENISEMKFKFKYEDLMIDQEEYDETGTYTTDNGKNFEATRRVFQPYPNRTTYNYELDQGNVFDTLYVDFSTGDFYNTTLDSDNNIVLKGDNSTGRWVSQWYNYTSNRTVDFYDITGNYSEFNYRTDADQSYNTIDQGGSTIQALQDTTSDSFQFEIKFNQDTTRDNDSYVFSVRDDTTIAKFSKTNGDLLGEDTVNPDIMSEGFVIGEENIYFGDVNDGTEKHVVAVNKNDLSLNWSNTYDMELGADAVAVDDEFVYAAEEENNILVKIWKNNGTKVSNFTDSTLSNCAGFLRTNKHVGVYAANTGNNYVYRYSKDDLSNFDSIFLGKNINDMQVSDEQNYFYYNANRTIYKADIKFTDPDYRSYDTQSDLDDSPLQKINYNPLRQRQVSTTDNAGNVYLFEKDLTNLNNYAIGSSRFFIEKDQIYINSNDGPENHNLTNGQEIWNVSELTTYNWQELDSYTWYSQDPQEVKNLTVAYKDTLDLEVKFYEGDEEIKDARINRVLENNERISGLINESYNTDWIWLGINKTVVDFGLENEAKLDYGHIWNYPEASADYIDVKYQFNNSNHSHYDVKNLRGDLNENNTVEYTTSSSKNIEYYYSNTSENNVKGNITSDVEITYITYKESGTSDYFRMWSDMTFMSLLFLTMGVGIIGYYSRSAGLPILVFSMGLLPLSYGGFVPWIITAILLFLFGGFYMLYVARRENKV